MDKCEHTPVEQIRGLMKKDDYFDVHTRDATYNALIDRLPDNYASIVDITADNATDRRIICTKCFHTTGWMKVDVPGYPGALKHMIPAKWNEIKGYSVAEWEELERARAKPVERDIKKLFPQLDELMKEHGRPVDGK